MKDNCSKYLGVVTSAGASDGRRWHSRGMQLICTLVLLFTFAIGNVWATDIVMETNAIPSTKGIPVAGTNGIYYTRGGGAGKKVTVSSKDYVSVKEEGFVFTLATESEITINTVRSSGTSTWSTFQFYFVGGDTLVELYQCALANNKKLSDELITWKDSTGKKKEFYTNLGITSASDGNNKILTGQTTGKFPVAKDINNKTFSKSSTLGTASTSLGTYAAGTYLMYFSMGDDNLGLANVTLTPSTPSTVAPTISAPTTDQSASYTIGDEIAALTVTASGTPTPTYQWYYNSSASTEGATSLGSSAQLASYTPSNAAASDLYYYCVVTNSAGSATSHYFHVTVSVPSTPTHAITYNETSLKGQSVDGYPTTYYEGTGIASFAALADVTDWHFNGWDPASISDTEDQDVEVFATWVAAYDVTFSAGAGSGTVPASFQKWEGAKFNLPGQGSMTAPSGKVFDGWKASGTKYAENAEYTMGNDAVEFVAQWKAVPQTIFDWTAATTNNIEADNTDLSNATYGTLTTGTSVAGRLLGSNTIAKNKAGYKLGNNDVCIEIAGTSDFQEGDTVIITATGGGDGERGFAVTPSSSDNPTTNAVVTNLLNGSVAGTCKVVLTSDQAGAKLRVFRHNSKTMYCKAIKVRRPAERPVASTVITLSDVKVNNHSISSDSLAILTTAPAYALTLKDEFVTAPEIKFNEHKVITYADELLPATKVTDKVYTVTATLVDGNWQAQQEIDGNTYTVTAPKQSSAKVTYYDGTTKIGEETVGIGGNPAGYASHQGKDYATFVAWYNNSDLAEEHKIADIAALVVTKDTTVYGEWNPAYATSINIEQWVLDNGIENAPFRAELTARHYKYATLNNLDSLNDDPSKPYRNYAYLGQKVNKTDSEISFLLKNGSTLKVRFGHLGSDINVIYGTDDPIALTSAEYANESPAGDKVYEYTATADVIVKFQCNGTSTSVFKQIMIDEPIATVVLPAIVTLNPNGGKYDDKTENTIVKYTGAPLVIGDATPADADHVFAGWYDGEDQINAAAYVPTANVELLAHYSNTEYTVTYVGGEDATGSMDPVQVAWDAEYTLATNAFAKEGHVWSGWVATYNDGVEEQTLTITEGKITMPKYNVTVTAQWTDNSKVAMIVETNVKYESFAAAIAAVQADQTIQLLQDCSYDLTWEIGANVTLDLNGKNLTYTYAGSEKTLKQAIKVNAGTLTLKDGTAISPVISDMTADPLDETAVTYTGGFFDMGANWGVRVYDGAAVVVESGKYKAQEAVLNVYYSGSATVNDGLLYTVDNGVVMGNGTNGLGGYTINIHGGILVGHITSPNYASMVVYHPNFGTLNIDGGLLISTNGPAVVVRGGVSHITGGTIIAKGTGSGRCGDASLVLPAVGIAADFKSAYPGVANTNVAISGTVDVNGQAGAVQAIYAAAEPTAAEMNAIGVSGGTFNTPIAEALCADGYVPETKANGKYGVIVPAQSIDFIAIIDAKGTDDEGKAELDAQLTAKHYDIDGTLNDDRLDPGSSKEADKGFKVKKTGLTISFSVEAGKVVEITTGSMSGASIKVDAEDAVAMTASHTHTYYSDDAQAFLITMTAASNKYNIFKSIVIRDPYQVAFEANGGDPVASQYAKPSVTLPSAVNGTKSLVGWFDAATGGTKVGDEGDAFTPTKDTTLFAQWEEISTDARLASITLDPSTGVLEPAFDPEVTVYTYTMPYGTAAIPQITGATAVNAGGSYSIVSQAAAWGETAIIRGVAASSDTKQYNITMVEGPKNPICLVKAELAAGSSAASITSTSGYYKDDANIAIDIDKDLKLGKENKYVKVAVDGTYFQDGDVVEIIVRSDKGASAWLQIFADAGTTLVAEMKSGVSNTNPNKLTIADVPANTTALYLYRTTASGTNMNPYPTSMAVYRSTNPILKSMTILGETEYPDADNKLAFDVPASKTLEQAVADITYDWISNDATWTAEHTGVAANDWAFGEENTVTFTDKDGDATNYFVTLNHAAASSDATLNALTYGTPATAIALEDDVYEYNVLLPYGTSDVPALAATAHHAGANVTDIDDAAAFVNRHATSTVTVTAEDGTSTQVYKVNFTVDRYESKVLWDGASMTQMSDITAAAAAAGVSITTTGISVTSFSAKTCEENGKSYTKALDFGGKTKSDRYFGIEIPAGKVAKVSLVYRAKGTGRSIMVATALSDAVDEGTITSKEAVDGSKLYIMTADMFGGGTLYINTTDGYHVHELSLQLADGHGRSAMLGAGVYGTVCVDHNVTIEDIQGVTVYELIGREPEYGKLAFDEIVSGELEAGVPYVFEAHRNHLALLYGETSVAEPVDKGNGMYGTFSEITLTELTGIYYFAQRALWSCADLTSLKVPANRAYVKLDEVDYITDPTPAPGRRRITMGVHGEQTATSIDTMKADDKPVKVMIDGKMYILRGEKMYDATGRLVK